MISKVFYATILMVAQVASAQAQGLTGGELGAEVFALTEDDDIAHTHYAGSAEFGITPMFSVAADLSSYRSNALSANGSNATVHGIFHFDSMTSFGAFVGRDKVEGAAADIYGIEGGTGFMGVALQGYVGQISGAGDAMIAGVAAEYDVTPAIAVMGDFALLQGEDDDRADRLSGGVSYRLGTGPSLYAEVGRIGVESGGESDSATFLGLGAKIAFGGNGGTTFDRRGVFEIIPGF